MPVTAETQAILDMRAGATPFNEMSPQEAREAMAALRPQGEPEPVAQVHEMVIPGPAGDIPARGYLPTDDPRELPTIVYFHGGGWVIGDLDSHDAVCERSATEPGSASARSTIASRPRPGIRQPPRTPTPPSPG